MKNYLTLLFAVLFLQSRAQTTFQKIYGNTNTDERGNGYCISTDGNYMIASHDFDGSTSLACLMKVDVMGNILWRKVYPGLDGFNSIITTIDGGYAIGGFSDSLNSPGDLDMFILKTDNSGNPQWCKYYGLNSSTDTPSELMQDQDGNFFMTGRGSDNLTVSGSAFIIKTDSTGSLLWDKIIYSASPWFLFASHISPTNDGGVIVTGASQVNNSVGLRIMKIDLSGQVSWSRCYGNNFYGQVTLQTNDGGYITSGSGYSPGISYGYVLLKSDSMGNFQWCKVYSNAISLPDLIINADGDYVLAGTHQDAFLDSANIYLIKTNPQGDTIWTRFYEIDTLLGYQGESASNILQTSDGGYLVGGNAINHQTDFSDIYLLKTDADGIAGCNQVYRQIIIESITPSVDTSITVASGILTSSILPTAANYPTPDTTLCLYDAINEFENTIPLNVFPNPASDNITISTLAFDESELLLEVKDIIGKSIIRKKIANEKFITVDVSSLSKGIYVISLSGKSGIGKRVFCKQ